MNDTTNLILTAAGALLLSLLGVSWRLLHGKIEDISDGLQKKADIDHLREIETRLQADLRYAKDANGHFSSIIDKTSGLYKLLKGFIFCINSSRGWQWLATNYIF